MNPPPFHTISSPAARKYKHVSVLGAGGGIEDIYGTSARPKFSPTRKSSPSSAQGRRSMMKKEAVFRLRKSLGGAPLTDDEEQEQVPELNTRGLSSSQTRMMKRRFSQKIQQTRRSLEVQESARIAVSELGSSFSSLSVSEVVDEGTGRTNAAPRFSVLGTTAEEQRKLLASFSTAPTDDLDDDSFHSPSIYDLDDDQLLEEDLDDDSEAEDMLEVAPGITMPLRSSNATFKAMMEGRVMVVTCYNCSNDLTVVDNAKLVLCADCLTCSPVDQESSDEAKEDDASPRTSDGSVAIGLRPDDILDWLAQAS